MEYKEFDRMMECWLRQQEMKKPSANAQTDWAIRAGITDGEGPRAFVTREEAVQMIYRAMEYFFRQIVGMLEGEGNEVSSDN